MLISPAWRTSRTGVRPQILVKRPQEKRKPDRKTELQAQRTPENELENSKSLSGRSSSNWRWIRRRRANSAPKLWPSAICPRITTTGTSGSARCAARTSAVSGSAANSNPSRNRRPVCFQAGRLSLPGKAG